MNKLLTFSLSAALFAGVSTLTYAQEPTATPDATHPRVEQVKDRQEKQADRVEAGEKSGELDKHEAKKLDKKEKEIQDEKKKDREKHDGHITKEEQEKLNRQQDKLGKKIYEDKHERRSQPGRPDPRRHAQRCGRETAAAVKPTAQFYPVGGAIPPPGKLRGLLCRATGPVAA